MLRFFARAGGVGVGALRSRNALLGTSVATAGGLLLLSQQSSLRKEEPLLPWPSFGQVGFQVLAETGSENASAAEEALAEAALQAEAEMAAKFEKEKAEKLAYRNAAEEAIRTQAEEAYKRAQKNAEKKASLAAAEEAISKEAEARYEFDNDPRNHPEPNAKVDETAVEDLMKILESKSAGEYEVFSKWKEYIDEITKNQNAQFKEQYDQKVKEIEEYVNKKMYQRVFREKELLEKKVKDQYRQAVQKLEVKFAQQKKELANQTAEEIEQSHIEYLGLVNEAKAQFHTSLKELKEKTDKALAKIDEQVTLQHSSRVEEQKRLMLKMREHSAYQKKLNGEFWDEQKKVALSLAALTLSREVNNGLDYNTALNEMADCSEGDLFLSELVKAIPRGNDARGIPTLMELQLRFANFIDQAFYDSLMGSDVSLWSYAKSRVVGNTLIRKKGITEGMSAEDFLARGEQFLATGDLGKCIKELENVKGPASVTLAAWLYDAKRRQETFLALEAIEAHLRVSLKRAN